MAAHVRRLHRPGTPPYQQIAPSKVAEGAVGGAERAAGDRAGDWAFGNQCGGLGDVEGILWGVWELGRVFVVW